jgi:tetratricopeptide (TPR) repeat protein
MRSHLLDSEDSTGWLGRALVAKQTGQDFASIVAHSQDVAQGACLELNYQYLLHLSRDKDTDTIVLSTELGRLLNSLDSNALKDNVIWNLIGLVYERTGNFGNAIEALDRAIQHCANNEDKLVIQCNLARLFLAAGQLDKSLSTSSFVNETGSSDLLSLFVEGLAHYFKDDIQSSLATFERAFATASSNSQLMSQAHLCLGKIVNGLGSQEGIELSKQQLFQSYTLDPTNREAMYSLLSTGLQTSDTTLIQSVLQELIQPILEKEEIVIEDSYVLSRYALITGDTVWAKKLCQKALHMFPANYKIWHSLVKILIK